MSKTVLFDLVFLTPRQKVSFGPRTQNDDFLGTRPRAAPLGSCQKNSSFFVLGTKLLIFSRELLLLRRLTHKKINSLGTAREK